MVGLGRNIGKILVNVWKDNEIPEVFEEKGIKITGTHYDHRGKSYTAWGKDGREHYYDESGREK